MVNKIQNDSFKDGLITNLVINKVLIHFKLKSIKELRKRAMVSPSDYIRDSMMIPCFRKKMNFTLDADDLYAYDKHLMSTIIDKTTTKFSGPEEVIVKQGDEAQYMFFIIKGDCTVN